VFHEPEIWLILPAVGPVPASPEVPPEMATDQNALAAAEANLSKQGSLLANAQGKHVAAPEITALVGAEAYPETVILASVADNAKFGNLARLTCFSWTPQATVINWVDLANDHHFESFAPGEAKACVWEHLIEKKNGKAKAQAPQAASPTTIQQPVHQFVDRAPPI
jgi:hypothetical protein